MNNTQKLKRPIAEISPEHKNILTSKKPCPKSDMSLTVQMDVLIKEMDKLLDKKLVHLATKEDITGIKNDIAVLQEENKILKEEILKLKDGEVQLKKKMEETEKFTKRMNVIVTGLSTENVEEAKTQFQDVCSSALRVAATTNSVRKISSANANKTAFVFELASSSEVHAVLSSTKNLTGKQISINKDLTGNERAEQFHLRQVKRCLTKADSSLRLEIKRWTLIVDGRRRFKCTPEGTIKAANQDDIIFIENLLSKMQST